VTRWGRLLVRSLGWDALRCNSTPKKLTNLGRAHLNCRLGRMWVASHPYVLIVDVTNLCNLRCRFCPTGRGEYGRQKGILPLATFQQFIDELKPYLYLALLYDWGEPLLNGELPRMIAYAEQNNICTSVHSNLCVRDDGALRELVDAGLSHLTVSVDGVDPCSYRSFRTGGDFALVMRNLAGLLEYRSRSGRRKPRITWKYVVHRANEAYVEKARQMAREIGVDAFLAATIQSEDSSVLPRGTFGSMPGQDQKRCSWLWTTVVLHWDGCIGPCCYQFRQEDDFGRYEPGEFMRIWNNDRFQVARGLFGGAGGAELPPPVLCLHCHKVESRRR